MTVSVQQKGYNDGKLGDGSIRLGLDWIIGKNGPVLLEMNLGPSGSYYWPLESQLNYFVTYCTPKTVQHDVFGDLMPDHCTDRKYFNAFIKRNGGKVVFKKDSMQMGEGVSVISKPIWRPDLLETYVRGKTFKDVDGQRYAMVMRNEVIIDAKDGEIGYEQFNSFRKVSSIPISASTADPNEQLRVNVMNDEYPARKKTASREEIRTIAEYTDIAMERLLKRGTEAKWDVRRAFPKKVILLEYSNRIADFEIMLKERHNLDSINISLIYDVENRGYSIRGALKAAEYGIDALISYRMVRFANAGDTSCMLYCDLGDPKDLENDNSKKKDLEKPFIFIIDGKNTNLNDVTDAIANNFKQNRQSLGISV